MPRNGSGTFAIVNPIQIGALRSSTAVNQNFVDAGTQITNTLPLDGQAGMTGQFKSANGTQAAPGIAFTGDANTGFRRAGSNEMRWVAGGLDRMGINSAGKASFYYAFDAAGAVNFGGALGGTTDLPAIEAVTGTGLAVRPADNAASLDDGSFVIPMDIYNVATTIPAGVRGDVLFSFPCTLTGIAVSADQAGSCVINIWKAAYADFPPTVDGKITGSTPATLTDAAAYSDLTLAGWTVDVAANDVLRFNIDSIENISRLSISLRAKRFV